MMTTKMMYDTVFNSISHTKELTCPNYIRTQSHVNSRCHGTVRIVRLLLLHTSVNKSAMHKFEKRTKVL